MVSSSSPDGRYSRSTGTWEWKLMAMRKVAFLAASAGLWAVAALSARATVPITDVQVKLPAAVQWSTADHLTMDQQYFHLWLPKGMSRENANWLVWVTRVTLHKPISAEQYANYLIGQFRKVVCSDLEVLGFQQIKVQGHSTYAISYLCKEEKDQAFGSVAYERIAVQDNHGYVIHGEVRILPSNRGRVLPLGSHGLSPDRSFRSRQQALQDMVTKGVTLCLAGGDSC